MGALMNHWRIKMLLPKRYEKLFPAVADWQTEKIITIFFGKKWSGVTFKEQVALLLALRSLFFNNMSADMQNSFSLI